MKKWVHPGDLNSSHFIFLLVSIGFFSVVMAHPFRFWSTPFAAVIITMYAVFFALSWKALKQFEDTDYLFVYFVLIFVALRFGIGVGLDALTDPLQEQQTPFLYGVGIFIYGSKLVDAAPTVLIQYALIVYLISLLAAGLMEAIYSGLSKFIPRRISKYLNGFDAKLDKTLRNLSDDHFAITNRGFWVGLVGFIGLGVVTYFIITSV